MRAMMLPAAFGLAAALLAGCSDSAAPTQSDQAQIEPSFMYKRGDGYWFKDDAKGLDKQFCRGNGWTLTGYTSDLACVDSDGDSKICMKQVL